MACESKGRLDGNETTSTTGTTRSDSAAYRDDTSLTAGTSGQTSASGSFAEQAMMANTAEVKLGELAAAHAQNSAVKQFAQMMVRDHTKAENELKQAVKGHHIEEPTHLDAKHQALYDKLNQLKGADFDREYMAAMVAGHRDVKNMLTVRANQANTAQGTSGSSSDDVQLENAVNRWASKALPVVSQHLQKAEQISGQTK